MKYDFDTVIDRRNSGSYKWDVAEGELPMWVADMDFPAAPCIKEALEKRVAHGVFGYNTFGAEWENAYISWWKNRHDFLIDREWLIFSTGVVPILSSVVRKLTTPAEKVLIMTPVYNIFFNSIINNGREVLESPLAFDGENYSIDYVDLEEKLSDPQTSMMILCNPHNPVGKIWDKETLAKIGSLCAKHGVIVVSDEIHCDITEPGLEYVPFASVNEECKNNCIMCVAPTKTFNIAGLQTAAAVVPNPVLRHKVWRGLNTDEVAEPNSFAIGACVAAFTEGADWVDELREYISENKKIVSKHLKKYADIKLIKSEATYLLWIYSDKFSEKTADDIRAKTGLYVSAGAHYGKTGEKFLRVNIACPKATLLEGLARFDKYFEE